MKKFFLILCALVCGTLAFAQTDGTYTGNLHVAVEGEESDTKDSQVTVEWDTDNTSQLDFTLHNFAISIGSVSLDLGDITIKQVDVDTANEKDGVAPISCTNDHEVELSDLYELLVSDITVNMTGTISDDKLYAEMTISVQLASFLGGSTYDISATFRSYSDDELNGDYLIVDADGNYLGGGLTYGTQAAIIGKPQFIGFEVQSDGTYHLDSHQYNNATSHYLGSNLYFDSTPVDWTIAAVSGGYTIYGTVDDGTGYLTSNGFQTVPTVEATPYVWTLVTKDDVIASMDNATSSAPVDVTALIAAPELKRNSNTTYYPTWTVTGYDGTGTPSNYAFGGGSAVANCAESYHSTNGFNFSQEITLPLKGYYTLGAKGFYRDDNSTTLLLPVLYAGSQTSTFPEITRTDEYLGVADNMANAYQEFLLGKHEIDAITIQATSEGEAITIGFKGEDTSLWNIMGELELLYYGEEAPLSTSHDCVADVDHWTISGNTNGDFHYNDWSVEADASGMTVPFLEYWVWSGEGNLSAATISHETLTDMAPGYYSVSLDIRIFSEAGNDIGSGTTFNANGVSEDLATGSDGHSGIYGTETEVYGTYTLICYVDENGKLDISINIPEGVTYNWIAFKNLSVTYIGESVVYNIGAGTADATCIKAGQEVTISFADCMYADEGAVLSATATGTLSDGTNTQTITLTGDGNGNYTFTVDESWDLAYNTSYTFTMQEGAVTWTYNDEIKFSSPAVSVKFTTPEMADITGVYLFNLGENEFLSRGHNNDNTTGTAADVDVYGLPVDITANADGKYNIRYIDSDLYIGGMYWATANEALANAASFTLVTDGTTTDGRTIYRFRNGSSSSTVTGDLYVNSGTSHGPLGLNDDDNGIKSTADRQWVIYSKDERDAFKAANVLAAKLATAQALDPSFSGANESDFDTFIAGLYSETLTNKVGGASLATADDLGYWTEEDYSTDGTGFAAGNSTIETYNDVDDLTQTITGLEEGIYKVTLQGYNRMGDAAYILDNLADYDISLATLGANDDEINLKTWASDREQMSNNIEYGDTYPSSMAHAAACFTAGLYNNELYTYVGEGGSLTITIACPDFLEANWVIFTNMTLTRYYMDDPYTYDVTWELANPSFEVDNVVANLTADTNEGGTSRCTDGGDGAWTITSLTGWGLTANSVSDLMSEKAAATDNNFGTPGKPADGTYMLYLRDAWASATDKVSQSVTLPAGDYKLTVNSKCVSGASGHSVQLTVGNIASANLTISSTMPSEWNTTSVKFSLNNETTLDVAVSVTYGGEGASGLSVLLDNFKLYSTEEIEETISWTMTDAGWGTLILPFDASIPSGLTAYAGEDITVNGSELEMSTAATSIVANTPYLVSGTEVKAYTFKGVPTNTADTYTEGLLTGTLVDLAYKTGAAFTHDGTHYLLQKHGDNVAFYPIVKDESADVNLSAYHCYLDMNLVNSTSAMPVAIYFPGAGGTTAIEAVEGTEVEANGAIYDLSGRKVSKAVKGVYIMNGKKVMVK